MGKKSQALEEEIDILRAEKRHLQEIVEGQDLELARLKGQPVGRMSEALTVPGAPQGRMGDALVRTPGRVGDANEDTQLDSHDTVDDARAAIAELRNPTPAPQRTESLHEIVLANNRKREELVQNVGDQSRLLSRIAAALGVTESWGPGGEALLEKAQRFSTMHYWIRNRIKEHVAAGTPDASGASEVAPEIRKAELEVVLAAMLAPAELAKLIQTKHPAVVTPAMYAQATEYDPDAPKMKPLAKADLVWLRDAAAIYSAENGQGKVADWLIGSLKSMESTQVLLDLLNLVLVPTLVKMKVVGSSPAR